MWATWFCFDQEEVTIVTASGDYRFENFKSEYYFTRMIFHACRRHQDENAIAENVSTINWWIVDFGEVADAASIFTWIKGRASPGW